MLEELRVEDFALVGRLELSFSNGLNVLTGETGAGKSILIDAVQAVLGRRGGADAVRQGCERAWIEAAFSIRHGSPVAQLLRELGYMDEGDDLLVLSREISANGRSKCRINGRLVNVSQLAQVGDRLVDIHGQHDQESLLSPARHLELLDALGGGEVASLLEEVAALASERNKLLEEIERLEASARERLRREELLRFQVEEIAAAKLEPGEEERLEAERARLGHAERLVQGAAAAYAALYEGGEGGAALDVAGSALRALEQLLPLDAQLKPSVDLLEQAVIGLQEAAHELRRYIEGIEADPQRLQAVEERLQEIASLKRKYGASVQEILDYLRRASEELEGLTREEESLDGLRRKLAEVEERLAQRAGELSRRRREVAERAAGEIGRRLAALNMPDARFEVQMRREADPNGIVVDGERVAVGRRGIDRVEFLFSANAGEEPRPLARIASGGEMSRVMLAIKSVLAEVDPCDTLIFDEIDAGIGGRTAESVASALFELSRSRQVLVVTHLAQIASRADRHLTVEKRSVDGRTEVAVAPIDGEERVREIARMLAGESTPSSIQHAKELLELARKGRSAS